MLDIIERLSFNAYKTIGATPPVIFRVIGNSPITTTMLLDEGDNQNLRLNAEYRKILNGNRRGDKVDRVIGKQVVRYDVFSPIAIAAVHDLYPALMQRSVIIYILQPPPGTKLEVLPQLQHHPDYIKFAQETADLQSDIELWSEHVQLVSQPANPLKLRTADNWRVLLAIADSFGRGDEARKAMTELVKGYPSDNPGANLLSDIQDIYNDYQVDRCFTKRMLQYLHQGEWSSWTGLDGELTPHSLNERELANILRRFKVYPTTIQPLGPRDIRGKGAKGYYRKDFEYAWSIYCANKPAVPPAHRNTSVLKLVEEKPKKKSRFKVTAA
jgi:hypothetical protein